MGLGGGARDALVVADAPSLVPLGAASSSGCLMAGTADAVNQSAGMFGMRRDDCHCAATYLDRSQYLRMSPSLVVSLGDVSAKHGRKANNNDIVMQ